MDKVKEGYIVRLELERLGYREVMMEGGYVSRDRATVIHFSRKPYRGQVSQFRPNREVDHAVNLATLRKAGLLED